MQGGSTAENPCCPGCCPSGIGRLPCSPTGGRPRSGLADPLRSGCRDRLASRSANFRTCGRVFAGRVSDDALLPTERYPLRARQRASTSPCGLSPQWRGPHAASTASPRWTRRAGRLRSAVCAHGSPERHEPPLVTANSIPSASTVLPRAISAEPRQTAKSPLSLSTCGLFVGCGDRI